VINKAISTISLNSISNDTDGTEGFELSSQEKKKMRRKENTRFKVITGTNRTGAGRFRGGDTNLFIARVHPDTEGSDIEDLVKGQGFDVKEIKMMSHVDAYFRSFRIAVPASQFDSLLSSEFPWPQGVMVRKFIMPRKKPAPPQ